MKSGVLAQRLKKLREEKGFLQKFVAEKIGVRSNTLSGYENGTRTPDPDIINALADLYCVTTDYLLGRSDIPDYTIKEEKEFYKAITDPELKRWHFNLPDEDEEDLKKLKMMWDIIKSDKNNTN